MRQLLWNRGHGRRLAWVAAVGLVVLAVSVAACSSRASTGGKNLSSAHADGTASDVLLAAVSKSSASDTVHLKMTMTLDGTGAGAQTVTGTGDVDFKNKAAEVDLHVLGIDMQMVTADDVVYLKAAILGTDWYRLDPSESAGGGGVSSLFTNGFADPAQQFTLLKDAATDVTTVGAEQVNGEQTTHYRATIDVTKAAKEEGADSQELQRLGETGITTLPVDVWVDGNGRIARLSLVYAAPSSAEGQLAGAKVSVKVDYLDYGNSVDIQTPPASQVKDFSESGIGQLIGGGRTAQ